jgi:hypothetical protein
LSIFTAYALFREQDRHSPAVWGKWLASTPYATKALGGDGAMVQAVHDASVHLGATCATPDDDEAEGKAAALRLRLKALTA